MADLTYEDIMGKPEDRLATPQVKIKDIEPVKELTYEDIMGSPKNKLVPDEDDDGPAIDMGGTLKKKDLYKGDNVNTIRNFMVGYRGADYKDAKDDQVVEDFVDTMRWFNGNVVSTAGVARYVYNGDDQQKADADKAFKLYDKLGNVFVNDGFFGAVDGVTDYMGAALADPTNWVGLLTGGISKASALGITQAGKQAVKLAAEEAGKRALTKGATQQAALKAGEVAADAMTKRLVARNVSSDTAKQLISQAGIQEQRLFLKGAGLAAEGEFKRGLTSAAAKKSVFATTGIDAGFAALNDIQIQNTMMQLDDKVEYSALQTGFSSLLGAVGGGMQIVGGAFKGASGLAGTTDALSLVAERQVLKNAEALALGEPQVKKATAIISTTLDSWKDKWTRGKTMFDPNVTPADLMHDIMLGPDGKGGLAKLFKDSGLKLNSKVTISDVMTNVVRQLPQAELKVINEQLLATGIKLGEVTELGVNLGDLLAKDIRQSAQILNTMSQVRKTMDAGIVAGSERLDKITGRTDVLKLTKEAGDPKAETKTLQYAQNFWKRMLVSSPATTAANVMGYASFATGQTAADLLSMTARYTAALLTLPINTKTSREMFRTGNVYRQMIGQKAKYLMDPFTTHDVYMDFLDNNADIKKHLFETMAGGIERSAKRYNIPEIETVVNGKKVKDNPTWFKRTEAVASAANTITGVRIQDSFTKSQMFIGELDKHVRLKHGGDLMSILKSGDLSKLDDEVVSNALDTTMKSVFAKDYTTKETAPWLASSAKLVESISNTPIIGTLLPFGRFFNNVVATGYQWTASGFVEAASAIVKTEKRNISTTEALSRSLVGVSTILMSIDYDDSTKEKGNPWNILEVGGAKIDIKNIYPASAFVLAGRYGRLIRDGEMVPDEILQDITEVFGVGNIGKDAQFGNDLKALLDMMANSQSGVGSPNEWIKVAGKKSGDVVAGVFRPLDAVNKLTGFVFNTDASKDVRQAEGLAVFSQSATRYIDNIIEIFDDKIDAITGEELRVGGREGRVQDPNPLASIFGIRVKPSTTSTEKAYSLAEMKDWTASERSQMPGYDKIFNELFAPNMEKAANLLSRSDAYQSANVAQRRVMLRSELSKVNKKVKDYLEEGAPNETRLTALRRKATSAGGKETRFLAKGFLKEKFGFEGRVQDMGYDTLNAYLQYIDYMDDYLKNK